MNARTIRRAAERKAAKLAKKQSLAQLSRDQHEELSHNEERPRTEDPSHNGAGAPQSLNLPGPSGACSPAMQAANEANARLSTGPVTQEGKAISSRNHTSHGLTARLSSDTPAPSFQVLPWENQAAYDALLASYRREWQPQTATEHDLIHRMCTHAWLRDRAMFLQNEIIAQVGEVMAVNERKDFALYLRYESTHSRAQSKAFTEMLRLRNFQTSQRRADAIQQKRIIDAQNRFESQKQKAELHAAKMETIRLKQEAIKQRKPTSVKPTSVEPVAEKAAATAQSSAVQSATTQS